MHIHAAILWEQGQPLSVESAELDPPGAGEVLIELQAAGVCHSDLHPARGDWPAKTPLVLGHEGAGVVREIGPSVTTLTRDDHVVLCWAPACGVCAPCLEGRAVLCDRVEKVTFRNKLPSGAARLHARGQDVAPFLGTACFSDFVIVPEAGAIKVARDVPFEALATIGCAVITGVGAVTNAGRVPPGSRVAVIGAGGVGLNVVQGAAIAGCERIIAIDLRPKPLEIARQFGATDTIDASGDVAPAVRALTAGRGADFVFDAVGSPATLTLAFACTRRRRGRADRALAHGRAGGVPDVSVRDAEKRLLDRSTDRGSRRGTSAPGVAVSGGQAEARRVVSRTYTLDKVNDAMTALAASDGARGVIRW
jgi:S-(hydroxymethyl)glutathione dehydrogenase/alcohol dehydrogenase